jgi:hypothetical protein
MMMADGVPPWPAWATITGTSLAGAAMTTRSGACRNAVSEGTVRMPSISG